MTISRLRQKSVATKNGRTSAKKTASGASGTASTASDRRKFKLRTRLARRAKKLETKTERHLKQNLLVRLAHFRQVKLLAFEWVLLAGALVCLALVQVFLTQGAYTTLAGGTGGTYTEATLGEITSLNPLYATTSSEKVLSKLLFATLTRVDASGHIGLGLASKLVALDDEGKTWRLELKDGLTWSDGEAITLGDVLFTIEVIQSDATNTIYETNLAEVKVKQVSDDAGEALIFTLPSAYADFAESLEIPILPAHAFADVDDVTQILESEFSLNPITSGAFTFASLQTTADGSLPTVYLTKNPDYYLGTIKLDRFAVKAYATAAEILTAINSGTVTATAELAPTDVENITNSTVYSRLASVNSGVFLFLNTASTNLKARTVRQAIATGLDLTAIRALAPDASVLDFPILASQVTLSSWPEVRKYDLGDAKNQLSGLAGTQLELATVDTGYLPAVAGEIQTQLENLGFSINLTVYDASGQDFLSDVIYAKNYDLLVYEVDLGVSPDPFVYYHSSQTSGLNLSNYKNALADRLILSARSTTAEAERAEYLADFLEQWITDVPAIGLFQANLVYFYNKSATNFADFNRLASGLDRFADVQEWSVGEVLVNRTP